MPSWELHALTHSGHLTAVLLGERTAAAFVDVAKERVRQELLVQEGKFSHTAASPDITNDVRLRVLVEEVGEVAEVLNDCSRKALDIDSLRKEIVQVAAVAVAWLEGLDAV